MAGLLIAGIVLAIVHHVFYQRLNGKVARSGKYAWDTEDQAWSTRFGTAIALLSKTCLAGAVAISYQQHIWSNLRDADYTMERIGGMFAAIENPFAFFHWEMLAKAKIATLLALTVWFLPFSALVSSSTLTVIASTSLESGWRAVPSIDFMRNPSFSIGDTLQVSPALERIAVLTGASKYLPPNAMPIANASYEVEFRGPSILCGTPSEDGPMNVPELIESIHNATSYQLESKEGPGEVVYMAASPTFMSGSPESFVQDCVVGTGRCNILGDGLNPDILWVRHQKEDIVCGLHETKYYVGFYSTHSTPHMILLDHMPLDRIADPVLSYRSATQSLVNLLTGAIGIWSAEEDCDLNMEFYEEEPIDKEYICGNMTRFTSARTRIWSTFLVGALNLTKSTKTQKNDRNRLSPLISLEDKALTGNMSLGPLIEELSRKLTVNLFSEAHFL
ncbi:MAG: hypothetical protein Q9180_006834 [Flavoplaca navasiana]